MYFVVSGKYTFYHSTCLCGSISIHMFVNMYTVLSREKKERINKSPRCVSTSLPCIPNISHIHIYISHITYYVDNVNLNRKIAYFWVLVIKMIDPSQIQRMKNEKIIIVQYIKSSNDCKCQALAKLPVPIMNIPGPYLEED